MVSYSSNRIYRSVVTAIAGLTLIGASELPKQAAQPEQAKAKLAKQLRSPEVSSARIRSTNGVQAPKKAELCGQSNYRGNANLCAQWNASDSASEAAKWACWQLILSALGVVGLGITLCFNFRALTRAGEANTIARNIGSAQTRGYISISPSPEGWNGQFNGAQTKLFVNLNVKNWGATPCSKVIIKKAIRLLPRDLVESPIGTDCSDFEQPVTIWPTQETPAGGAKADRVFNSAEIADALDPNGSNRIYLIALVKYQDFSETDRKTEYLAFMEPNSVIRDVGAIKTWVWVQYPEFNNAT